MHSEANLSIPHPTPPWPAVVREQFRTVGASVRGELVAAGLLLAGATLLMLVYVLRGEGHANFVLVDMAFPAVLLGFFAPFGVWKGEEPARRAYLWALPVARSRNTLVKVLGGWGWLIALVGAYLLWAVAMTVLTGGDFSVGGEIAQALTHRHLPPEQRIRALSLEAWMWLVPFTGATVTYLIGTVAAVWTDRPWRWFAAAAFTCILVVQLIEGIVHVDPTLNAVTTGRYGLVSVMTGMPSAGGWAGATLVWMVCALAAVLVAAHRHQER